MAPSRASRYDSRIAALSAAARSVRQKRASHTIDGGSHRWKIDDDLIRKATRLRTTVVTTEGGHGSGAERTKGITVHEQW